jgi:hypothetical protein
MKKFSVMCDFNGKMFPFTYYVGEPEPGHHPLHFQANWLGKERGGNIPGPVMETISKLYTIATENNVSFEELCVYALGTAYQERHASENKESKENKEEDAENTGENI